MDPLSFDPAQLEAIEHDASEPTADYGAASDLSDLLTRDEPGAMLAQSVADRVTMDRESIPREDRVARAAQLYRERKERKSYPAGSFDKYGRWYPAQEERCPHCSAIRTPSVAWPYTLLLHCRTAGHIAAREGLQPIEIKRAARKAG